MHHSFLAETLPASAAAAETLTRGQKAVEAAWAWVSENGVDYAIALLTAVVVYVVGSWVAGLVRRLVLKALDKRGMDHTFASYLANILHGIVMVVVIITALGELGIPTAQFAALIAAAGLAIGLALQGNLSNFASGFLLVFFRPFKRGDYLAAGGAEGTVEEIGIFTTTMLTLDNKKVVVPNSAITGGIITNFSANPKRLVAIPCTVGGSNPPARVRAALLRAAAGQADLLDDPAPVAVITALGENKYTIELRVWCHPANYWSVLFSLNEAVRQAAEEEGVTGPLPAMRLIKE